MESTAGGSARRFRVVRHSRAPHSGCHCGYSRPSGFFTRQTAAGVRPFPPVNACTEKYKLRERRGQASIEYNQAFPPEGKPPFEIGMNSTTAFVPASSATCKSSERKN